MLKLLPICPLLDLDLDLDRALAGSNLGPQVLTMGLGGSGVRVQIRPGPNRL